MTIDIRSFLASNPKAAALRKRKGRTARPVRASRANELWYKAELLKIVNQLIRVSQEELVPELKRLEPLYVKSGDSLVGDSLPRRSLETTVRGMAKKFGGINKVAERLSEAAAKKNLQAVDERLVQVIRQSIGVDISAALTGAGEIAKAMQAAVSANVDLITSIPEQYFDKLEAAVMKNMERGVRWESLAKEVERIGEVTKSRAKLIARDQTSKMNGDFNRVRQVSVGINEYRWRTAGDERVRPGHRENNGKVFSWKEAPARTGHPGHDVQCRCSAEPYFNLDKMEEELFE